MLLFFFWKFDRAEAGITWIRLDSLHSDGVELCHGSNDDSSFSQFLLRHTKCVRLSFFRRVISAVIYACDESKATMLSQGHHHIY